MLSQLANSVCLSVLMSLGFPWQYSKLLLGVDTKEQLLLVPVPNGPVYTYSKQQLHYKIGIKSTPKFCKNLQNRSLLCLTCFHMSHLCSYIQHAPVSGLAERDIQLFFL